VTVDAPRLSSQDGRFGSDAWTGGGVAGVGVMIMVDRTEGSTIFGGECLGPESGEGGEAITGTIALSTRAKKRIAGVAIAIDVIVQPILEQR
jgi:hypothetical protein